MNYVFDPEKDKVNRAKHRLGLDLAEIMFAGRHVSIVDDRFEYGETRKIAFGLIVERMVVCVYVDRGAERRVISLRKANQREVERYGQKLE